MLDEAAIRKVLVVVAHPDDIDFGGAGTIAKLTDAGAEVVYCLVTDGEAGGPDHETPAEKIAATRRAEQTAAAKCVSVSDLRWLGYPHGTVEYPPEPLRANTRETRAEPPD